MSFTHPAVLVAAAIAIAAFVLVHRALERRGDRFALDYSHLAFADAALRSRVPYRTLLTTLWIVAAAALATAFAGPHLVTQVPAADGAVVLCVDTSGSMSSTDVVPTRAQAAEAAAHGFVEALPAGTRVGIVAFSTSAAVVTPLTADREAIGEGIDRIPAPNGGTAIGDALTAAASQLPDHGGRAIVLVTDGVNNHGVDPLEAAQTIGARGVAIYTVGIGTNSGALVPGTTEEAALDEDALRAIAQSGHGSYARAVDARELRGALAHLASGTVWERKRVDASFAFAAGGGALMLAAFLTGLGLGKYP